nr:RDD family protein [Bacillus sp. HNG]
MNMDLTHEGVRGSNHVHDHTDRPIVQEVPRYAGFWMRFWAYLLDLVVIGSINRILIYPAFRALDIPLTESHIFSATSIATAVVFYLYFVLMTKFFNQTLGKMVFGIKVVPLDGKSLSWMTVLFREFIGRYISKLFFIGYIIVAFLPKKQGIHDLLSDTTVIHAKK